MHTVIISTSNVNTHYLYKECYGIFDDTKFVCVCVCVVFACLFVLRNEHLVLGILKNQKILQMNDHT